MKIENKFVTSLNIGDGIITYNDFDIDENIPFDEQRYSYKEDMLQIKFNDKFVIDVGWLPDFDSAGEFVVQVIQDEDWTLPLYTERCKTLHALKKTIEKMAHIINKTQKDNNHYSEHSKN